MTKRNLLLVGLLVVFGLGIMAPAALAQAPVEPNGTIVTVSTLPFTLRPNSNGDAVGPIFLNFGSGSGTIAGGEAFTVTFSQPIVGASGSPSAISSLATATAAADFCDDTHATHSGGGSLGFCTAMTYTASGSALTLTNGATAITGWTAGYITIWGLRFATAGLPAGTPITGNVSAAANLSYPVTFNSAGAASSGNVTVGTVANVSPGGTVSASVTPVSILSCTGVAPGVVGNITVVVTENWAGAWTSLTDEMHLAPFAPSAGNTVTNGSDISITFSNIPSEVTIGFTQSGSNPSSGSFHETWKTVVTTTGATSVLFDFPLATTVQTEEETATFTFAVSTTGAVPPNTPAIVATVTLNPPPSSTTYYPAFTYPISASLPAESGTPASGAVFIGCQTSLLFPYVTNYTLGPSAGPEGNWDTGLEIANTTSDPYNYSSNWSIGGKPVAAGATAEVGSCTFYVYNGMAAVGVTPTATPPTPIQFTTPMVPTGGIWTGLLSGTAAKGISGGYAIAICNFQNAIGYAETLNNFGGNPQVLGSYLAFVIPNPYYVPRSLDAVLGEFAIMHNSNSGWWNAPGTY